MKVNEIDIKDLVRENAQAAFCIGSMLGAMSLLISNIPNDENEDLAEIKRILISIENKSYQEVNKIFYENKE